MLRFWESDVLSNINEVAEKLHKEILKSGSHYDSILYRDENTSLIEREASSFASKLLMPSCKFKEYIHDN